MYLIISFDVLSSTEDYGGRDTAMLRRVLNAPVVEKESSFYAGFFALSRDGPEILQVLNRDSSQRVTPIVFWPFELRLPWLGFQFYSEYPPWFADV